MFGPRAIFGGIAEDPAPEGAPTVNGSLMSNPPNNWSVNVTQIGESDARGILCVIVPQPDPSTDPLSGLTAEQARELPGAIVNGLAALPDETVVFSGTWPDEVENGTPVSGGCYSTDRSSDLEG